MHLPAHNAEFSPTVLRQFIRENPLGIITTAIRSPSHPFLQISHIPWVIDVDDESGAGYGRLQGHIARQNPQAKAMIEVTSGSADRSPVLEEEVLVLFNAPAHHYVTPQFYKETKPTSGKVVPTWNYEAVQVYGRATVFIDSKSEDFNTFLDKQISDLSQHAETVTIGYGTGDKMDVRPWAVSDAPTRYIDLLKKNIIGIEIEITSMAGRFKMSQEKTKNDRDGVIEGMQKLDDPLGLPVAEMVQQRAAEFDARKAMKKEQAE